MRGGEQCDDGIGILGCGALGGRFILKVHRSILFKFLWKGESLHPIRDGEPAGQMFVNQKRKGQKVIGHLVARDEQVDKGRGKLSLSNVKPRNRDGLTKIG